MQLKKELTAASLTLCLLLSACGQQPDPRYADYIETDMSKFEEHRLYDDVSLCGHKQSFHSIEVGMDEFSNNGRTSEEFIAEKGWGFDAFNIIEYVEFTDISKDGYKAYVDKYYPLDSERTDREALLKDREEFFADMEIIYCGNETKINNYFNENIQTYFKDENEEEPTKNFFYTHGALIRYVGVEKYHEYLKHVIRSKYDNVKNFIEYFKIDRSTFEEVLREAENLDFYNIDELF